MEGERKVTSGNGRKHQVHLLQLAVLLFRCHSCSAAGKTTAAYIIFIEL